MKTSSRSQSWPYIHDFPSSFLEFLSSIFVYFLHPYLLFYSIIFSLIWLSICILYLCTTIPPRYSIFSTRYSVMCQVYTGYHGTSEIEHGLCACKARGLSLSTSAQTMLNLKNKCIINIQMRGVLCWSLVEICVLTPH